MYKRKDEFRTSLCILHVGGQSAHTPVEATEPHSWEFYESVSVLFPPLEKQGLAVPSCPGLVYMGEAEFLDSKGGNNDYTEV